MELMKNQNFSVEVWNLPSENGKALKVHGDCVSTEFGQDRIVNYLCKGKIAFLL